MNLIAIFPPGQTEVSVNGLHQWDYGRKLEIHASDLPTLVEVHFACLGMEEAVVRVCNVTRGVAVATIPDTCLEQTTPITAWVYVIGETTGATKKRITLPIEARTRPSATADIPVEISDKYTEAVTAMNEAVEKISSGEVPAAMAIEARKAKVADNAINAVNATSARIADTAKAVNFGSPVASAEVTNGSATMPILDDGALYLVLFKSSVDTSLCIIQYRTETLEALGVTVKSRASAVLNSFYVNFTTEENITFFTSSGTLGTTAHGTLYFYKLGGITA